jgi:hypothetical protein
MFRKFPGPAQLAFHFFWSYFGELKVRFHLFILLNQSQRGA